MSEIIDLTPAPRRMDAAAKRRRRRWFLTNCVVAAAAIAAIFIGGTVAVGARGGVAGLEAMRAELGSLESELADLEARSARLSSEVLSAEAHFSRPDWSLFMRAIAQAADEGVTFRLVGLSGASDRLTAPDRIVVEGAADDARSVAAFAIRLQEIPAIAEARVESASRDATNGLSVFRLTARLVDGVADEVVAGVDP